MNPIHSSKKWNLLLVLVVPLAQFVPYTYADQHQCMQTCQKNFNDNILPKGLSECQKTPSQSDRCVSDIFNKSNADCKAKCGAFLGDKGLAAPAIIRAPEPPVPGQSSCEPAYKRWCNVQCNGDYGNFCFPSTVCNANSHRCEKTGP
jgi:hypothetical protein